jgi:hypothetical protein
MMQQQQYHGGMSTAAMSSWSKPGTWYLLNLKTMKPVKSYEQLSRIMQNLGWSFYVLLLMAGVVVQKSSGRASTS